MPAPGSILALAERPILPVILALPMPKEATPVGYPLMGLGPPSRLHPKSLPTVLTPPAPLVGFASPSAHSGGESPRHARFPGRAPRFPGNLSAGPTPPTTVPLTGFLNLAAASSSLYPPTIFRWVTLMGFGPPGVFSSLADSTARRCRHAFLTFLL